MNRFPHTLFITGTDTSVGKTFISALLCQGLLTHWFPTRRVQTRRVHPPSLQQQNPKPPESIPPNIQGSKLSPYYWKPIQSGSFSPTDTEWVKSQTDLPHAHLLKETYLLKEPLSPHLSAKKDKIHISLNQLSLPSLDKNDYLIIEGCGGLLVPLNETDLQVDLLKKWQIPTLLVARSTLGTINHTLLTLHALAFHQIPIWGIVLNGPESASNKEAIEHFGKIPVLAQIPFQNLLTPKILQDLFEIHFGKYL